MTEEETKKHHWLRIASIGIIIFIAAFLAFYIVMEIMINRITDASFNAKKIERYIKSQEREFRRIENKMLTENPFEPRLRPMLVNLIKENSEYKVVVDLRPLDGDENAINVDVKDKMLIINGEVDKNKHGTEKIINFSQTYYLDENLKLDKIEKEKKGDKYIITIPFED